MELRLERSIVRDWRLEDKPALLEYADNPKVARNLMDRFPHPYTPADADEWLQLATTQDPRTNFAIEVGGEAVGGCGLELRSGNFRRSAEIGYWLGEPFWGRGIATEVAIALSGWAFDTFDICRITAGVFAWNPASGRVLEKAGFVREAVHRKAILKQGEMIDEWVYALVR